MCVTYLSDTMFLFQSLYCFFVTIFKIIQQKTAFKDINLLNNCYSVVLQAVFVPLQMVVWTSQNNDGSQLK